MELEEASEGEEVGKRDEKEKERRRKISKKAGRGAREEGDRTTSRRTLITQPDHAVMGIQLAWQSGGEP